MNISGTSQSNPIEIQYISSNGSRKTLASTDDGSVKAAAVEGLAKFECPICYDVHEKPLQTRCCQSVICASCYLSLPSPKKCPSDRAAFTGSAQHDLQISGRLINNQIEEFVANFNDVQSTEVEVDAEKSRKQNDMIKQLTSRNSQSTSQPARQNVGNVNIGGVRLGGGVVINPQGSSSDYSHTSNVSVGNMHIGFGSSAASTGGGITINEQHIQGRNLIISNGQIVSGQNVTITNAGQTSQGNPIIRTHDFRSDDVLVIYVHITRGNISIEGQNFENQNKVSITSSEQPRLNGGVLSLNDVESVSIKVPESFCEKIELRSNMGSITTQNGYSIKSGGRVRTNMGNVDVKVDGRRVKVKGRVNVGRQRIQVRNHSTNWERRELRAESNMGNVNVYD